jgi:hypothetical protein
MGAFVLWGFAGVGVVASAITVAICAVVLLAPVAHRAKALITARRGRYLEDMPGHPERVRRLPDLAADTAFWDIAEELLGDPAEPFLPDVCERLGWLR